MNFRCAIQGFAFHKRDEGAGAAGEVAVGAQSELVRVPADQAFRIFGGDILAGILMCSS